mgnify:CR=1 FL=1|tara:strand:+ start:99 stop:1124 length:1026 start_codon:yes stop_codon:yes gene_type:complete
MYKTHVKLQPAEGPVNWWWSPSYTEQFKYDAERSNFDTYKTWYTELNKWIGHLTEVDKADLIELQKKLQRKFNSDFEKKTKHRGWKCPRKDNDCEVPVRMRKFIRALDNEIQKNKDKEIRKELIQALDIPQRSSVIDVVEDFKRKGLLKHLQQFFLFCGDISVNIHHIISFMIFYVDNKEISNPNSTPVTDMTDITTMPLKEKKDMNEREKAAATELCKLYMASEPFLEPAEGRFLSAEPGAHAPLIAHMLFGNPVEYIFTSLLGLIKTFAGLGLGSAIVIAILCLVAWLCPTKGHEPTSQTSIDMEPWIQEEQDISELRKLDVNDEDNKKKKGRNIAKMR